jgi:hypothetical protein
MSLAALQSNPEFQKLSPEARAIVIERMSANDENFAKLSPEAQTVVKQRLTGAAPKKETEAEPITPYVVDRVKKGLAGTLSLPSLLADTLLSPATALVKGGVAIANQFRDEDKQLQSPDWLKYSKAASGAFKESLGVKDIATPKDEYGKPSKTNEYLGAIAEFAGGGVIPGAAVVAAAPRKGIALATEAATTLLGATGAVEGKEIGKSAAEMIGFDPIAGEKIGEVLGSTLGVGTAAIAANAAQKGGSAAADFIKDRTGLGGGLGSDAQKQAAKVMASRDIGKAIEASPAAPANMAEAVALQDQVPGFQPTLGSATNAPGVIAIEKKIANSTPEALAKAAEREASNIKAISAFEQDKFPPTAVSPIAAVKQRATEIEKTLQNRLADTETKIGDLAAKIDSGVDTAAIGNRLRVLREESRQVAQGIKNQKYQAVYKAADEAKITEPVSDVLATIKTIAGDDANAAQMMPRTFDALKSAAKKYEAEAPKILTASGNTRQAPEAKVPFQALHSMQKEVNKDLGAAVAAGDGTRAYYINQVKDVIDAKVAKYEGAEYGDVAAKLKDANDFYKNKYAAVFNEGVGGRMGPRAVTKFGEMTQDADIVKKLVFSPGNRRGVEEFYSIYGVNPEASKLLKNGVYDMLATDVVRDGVIKPGLVEAFVRKHKQQLDLMPGFQAELKSVDALNDKLLARRVDLQELQKRLDNSVVQKIAQTEDVAKTIDSALTSPKEMRALLSQAVKTKDGSMALSRAIADAVSQKPNSYQFLMENQELLKPALDKLGKDHFNNLKTLAKAQEIAGRVKAPTDVNLTRLQDLAEQAIGTSGKGILSRMMNAEKGYMSGTYVTFDLGGRYIYKIKSEEAAKLTEAAIYDPALAKALLDMQKQPAKEAMNNLKYHAYSHGIRVLSTQQE